MASKLTFSRRGGYSKTYNTTYRSGLEDKISEQLANVEGEVCYEKYKIPYVIPASNHIYTPDFLLPNGIIVEAKGLFEVGDRQKHLFIKEQYKNLDIRFVFSNTKTKLYKGSKTTYAEWCEKHNFKYANKLIPLAWLEEGKKDTKGLVVKVKK